MALGTERMFYTTDETLQEALLEREATVLDIRVDQTSNDCSSDSSYESDTEPTNEPSSSHDEDEDRNCDDGTALESIADRYYEHSMHAQQETATQGSQREAEHKLTFERFQRRCGCSLNCFSAFTVAEVANVRCSVKALTKPKRDMLLLGKLQTFYEPLSEGSMHPTQKRARLTYAFDSREVCEGAFCFIHGVGDFSIRSLKTHLRNGGITSRTHGNKGRRPAHAHTRFDILNVLVFVHQYAKVNGLPQPAPPKGRAGQPLHYLPAYQNKKVVHGDYECACRAANNTPVGYRSFRNIWRRCLPWIHFMTPRTDVCNKCEVHRARSTECLQ